MEIKYRVHELAKDFNKSSKDISEILTKYGHEPKNHMTVLTPEELDIVFETLTQQNAVESFESFFMQGVKAEPEAAEEKKTQEMCIRDRSERLWHFERYRCAPVSDAGSSVRKGSLCGWSGTRKGSSA